MIKTNIIKAGVILFSPNKKYVLLVKSKSDGIKKSKWGFPKGNIEPNEKINDCAMRELKEETGLLINIDNNITLHNYTYQGRTLYYCYILNNNMMINIINTIKFHKDNNDEIDKIAFVPLEKCLDLVLNSEATRILNKYTNYIDIAVKL
jgi:8-oxo-dGTP pyrophosphatase MutT (NUDIX family)